MSFVRNLALKIGLSERRNDQRAPAHGLEASYWTGVEQKRVKIKDISPTGIFLVTRERWLPGATFLLTLEGGKRPHGGSKPQVRIRVRVVRIGEDGVGLTFVHDHVDMAEWLDLMAKAVAMTAHNDTVRLFQITTALAFLLRIAPSARTEILEFITKNPSPESVEKAIEISLQAEEILSSQNLAPRADLSPELLLRILRDGSMTREEQVPQYWAGLLAASTLDGTEHEASTRFAGMLCELHQVSIRILSTACVRAIEGGSKPEVAAARSLVCPADELRKIVGARDINRVEQELNNLYRLGLLEQTVKSEQFEQIKLANITPTPLGLKFYLKCSGQVELPD